MKYKNKEKIYTKKINYTRQYLHGSSIYLY